MFQYEDFHQHTYVTKHEITFLLQFYSQTACNFTRV